MRPILKTSGYTALASFPFFFLLARFPEQLGTRRGGIRVNPTSSEALVEAAMGAVLVFIAAILLQAWKERKRGRP